MKKRTYLPQISADKRRYFFDVGIDPKYPHFGFNPGNTVMQVSGCIQMVTEH